ncbi:hypothetical protein GALL_53090 [mine drainage metagenome]|uniref:Lipoprotein n=1 Tax=mine drainage metagenome TaxID=410659 RepID=A0A1J5TB19_9ZZZZ
MKFFRIPLALLLLGLFALIMSGCTTRTDRDSSIPWGRPANWEGQIPGMGATPGSGIPGAGMQ